jgi:hypothetical protein
VPGRGDRGTSARGGDHRNVKPSEGSAAGKSMASLVISGVAEYAYAVPPPLDHG